MSALQSYRSALNSSARIEAGGPRCDRGGQAELGFGAKDQGILRSKVATASASTHVIDPAYTIGH